MLRSHGQNRKGRGKASKYLQQPAKGQSSYNNNYCLTKRGFVGPVRRTETLTCTNSVKNVQTLINVSCLAVNHVPFVVWQLQKKGIRTIVKTIK